MWGQMEGKTKMEIAADVLSSTVDSLPENQQIGLVAYGHRKKGDCEDVEFLVNIGDDNKTKVNQSLKNIKPLGKTPLAY
jgi:Ca-activated chloride channel family protein